MPLWKSAESDRPPLSKNPCPVWVWVGGGEIVAAFHGRDEKTGESGFLTADDEILDGVTQWMLRKGEEFPEFHPTIRAKPLLRHTQRVVIVSSG